jgi:hypothetical protein
LDLFSLDTLTILLPMSGLLFGEWTTPSRRETEGGLDSVEARSSKLGSSLSVLGEHKGRREKGEGRRDKGEGIRDKGSGRRGEGIRDKGGGIRKKGEGIREEG